jgi:putative tryptophan/tyrosine transport system substrate-binding protein
MGRLRTRREVLAGCIALCSIAGRAFGEPSRPQRVALVTSGRGVNILEWMRATLRTLGYEEGKNIVIEFREANGRYAELPKLLAEVIALKPDVIVAEATPAIAAAQQLTSTIPIVMAPATDPVGSGFVRSFARPGGNITGVANMFDDLTAKTLDIVRLVFPEVKRIGILTSANPRHPFLATVAIRAAGAVGIAAENFCAPNPEDLERAFADMKAADCEIVYVLADPPRPALPPLAAKYGLPAVYQVNSYLKLGGLMSYGPDIQNIFVRASYYVDRILKGGNPADMAIEQPTNFVFVINLQNAKTMNLIIPERVLLMADEVIE